MSIDEIAPEALNLPPRERALLAASLWESIGDPFEIAGEMDDEDTIALAEARDRDLDSGKAIAISHEELMRRDQNKGARRQALRELAEEGQKLGLGE